MKNRTSSILILFILIFFSLPISIIFYENEEIKDSLYIIGIIFTLILISRQFFYKKIVFNKKLFSAVIGVYFILVSNLLLQPKDYYFISLIVIYCLHSSLVFPKKIIKYLIYFLFILIALQLLLFDIIIYPNSSKIILLFWNPNVLWFHLLILLIFQFYIEKKIYFIALSLLLLLSLYTGTSRTFLFVNAILVILN